MSPLVVWCWCWWCGATVGDAAGGLYCYCWWYDAAVGCVVLWLVAWCGVVMLWCRGVVLVRGDGVDGVVVS